MRFWILLLCSATALTGCYDDNPVSPRVVDPPDVIPPAAPRGVYSVTGDGVVTVHWLLNTEADVAGYRIYQSTCDAGPGCPYDPIGVTAGDQLRIDGLANGVTRFYAVAAYDLNGNEGDLSYETVFDTPRPAGVGLVLSNYLDAAAGSGYDFSAFAARPWDDPETDIFFGDNGSIAQMFVPDFSTDIQDAGFTNDLDDVDFAPSGGWSPTGSVELIRGHAYVVWMRDDHYAKFRVTSMIPSTPTSPARVVTDWAYQIDPGNRELKARPIRSGEGSGANRRPIHWAR